MPDLKSVLDASPVDDRVRADAWDAFQQAKDPDDFKKRFDALPLPENAKADLWDLKFSQGAPQQPQTPVTPPPQATGPSMWQRLKELPTTHALKSVGLPTATEMYERAFPPIEKPQGALEHVSEFARKIGRTPAELADFALTPEGAATIATGGMARLPGLVGRAAKQALPAIGSYFGTQMTKELAPIPGVPESGQVGKAFVQNPSGGTAADVLKTGAMAVAPLAHAGVTWNKGSKLKRTVDQMPPLEGDRMAGYRNAAQAQGQALAGALRPGPMPPAPEAPAAPVTPPRPRPVVPSKRAPTGNLILTEEGEMEAVNAAMDRLERPRTEPMPAAPSQIPEERFAGYKDRAVEQGQEFKSAVEPGTAENPVQMPPLPEAPKPGFGPEPGRPLTGGLLVTEDLQREAAENAAMRLETAKGAAELPRKGPGRATSPMPPEPPPEPGPVVPTGPAPKPPMPSTPAAAPTAGPGLVGQILDTHQQTGGSTFNLRSGQNLAGQKFYSVSPFKELEQIIDHDPTSQDITAFVSSPGVREKLFDPSGEYSLGTWRDSESGKTYLDVVVTTPELGRAIEIGKKANQIAAFDLSKVDPKTGNVADGAEIPIQRTERMLKLYHWSKRPDLETLEPSKYGTGEAGAEMRRKENAGPDWVDRTYYQDQPEPVEPGRFGPGTRSPHQYETEIAENRIYDLTKDPDGLREGGDITVTEKRIRDLGYAGYKGAYPDGTPAYAVFEPMKASLRERLETAANDAAARIKERQGAMPRESILTGESGASTVEMNFIDMSIWGGAKLMLKAMDFAEWAKEMAKDFPQLAKASAEELEKLYKRSQWVLSNHIERTADGLPSVKKLTKLYAQGKDFKDWYQKSHDEVEAMFGEDAGMFLSMLAATSPMSSVRSNTVLALRAYEQWKTGKPFNGFIENIRAMLTRLTSGDPNWANPETAPKVHNFNRALQGDPNAFTADRWWGREFGFGDTFHENRYKFIDYAGTQVAKKLGVPVREYQAAGWAAIKEKLADLDFASDDFGTVLKQVVAETPAIQKYLKTNPGMLDEIKAKVAAEAEAPPDWVMQPMSKVVPKQGPVREFWRSEAGGFTPGKVVEAGKDAAAAWERKMIDDLSDIRHFTSRVKMPAELDPYKLGILHSGRGAKVLRRLTRGGGLREIIRPAYKEGLLKDVTNYALLERYEELGKPKSGGGHGISQFPNGKALPQILAEKATMEARLGPQKLARVKGYIQQLYDYSDRILQEARDGGLISADTYRKIKATNEKYVPLQRLAYVSEQLDSMHPGSNIFSVPAQSLVKAIKGSKKEVLDPIQGIINNTIKSVNLISRNRVALAMADLSQRPEFAGDVIRIKGKNAVVPDGFDTFSVLREGRKEVYAVPKLVADAMKRLNPEQADFLTKVMAWSNRMLKGGAVTFNTAFIIPNAWRDFFTAKLKSEVGFNSLDWMRGLSRAIFKGDIYDKYLESGGAFGGYFEQFKSVPESVKGLTGQVTLKSALSVVNPLEYIKAAGAIVEMAPRIGVFERALKMGKSLEEAGYIARDSTVNFSKAGSTMRVLNLWVPFLNARQQGSLNVLRAFRDHPSRAAMVATAFVGVPAILTYLHNTQNHAEVWNDIADFEKRANFIIIYGDARDEEGNPTQVIKIPKGDVGQALGNPVEHFMAWAQGKETKTIGRLALELGSDVNPVPFEREGKVSGLAVGSAMTPSTAKALAESWTNKNWWTGREIVTERHRMKQASPGEQYWIDTPKLAVGVGQFLGVSPKHVQNFIGTQFGGLGRQVMQPTKAHETVTKRFVGAKGGGQEQREFEEMGKIRQEGADEAIRRSRGVQTLYNELVKMPVEQRGARIKQEIADKKLDEKGFDVLVDLIENESLGLKPHERSLKSMPVAERARYINSHLKKLPVEQRRATLERWIDTGIMSDDVIDAIMELP